MNYVEVSSGVLLRQKKCFAEVSWGVSFWQNMCSSAAWPVGAKQLGWRELWELHLDKRSALTASWCRWTMLGYYSVIAKKIFKKNTSTQNTLASDFGGFTVTAEQLWVDFLLQVRRVLDCSVSVSASGENVLESDLKSVRASTGEVMISKMTGHCSNTLIRTGEQCRGRWRCTFNFLENTVQVALFSTAIIKWEHDRKIFLLATILFWTETWTNLRVLFYSMRWDVSRWSRSGKSAT